MTRTPALIVAVALSVYCSCACAQGAAPPTGQAAHDVAASTDAASTDAASTDAASTDAASTDAASTDAASTDAASTDAALTKAIYSALNADPNYYFRHVTVRVDKGVANLSGFVGSSAAINRARTIASKVPGVTRVATNHLQVDTQLRR